MPKRSVRMLAVVAAFLAIAGACGGSSKFDELKATLETQVRSDHRGVKVDDINCGENPSLDPGSDFLCTAGIDGGSGRLRIQVTIDNDGIARYERLNARFDLDRLELEIAADLLDGLGYEVGVDCGDGFSVEEVGSAFTCTVTASGDTAGVRVTVNDVDANTDWFFPVAVGS